MLHVNVHSFAMHHVHVHSFAMQYLNLHPCCRATSWCPHVAMHHVKVPSFQRTVHPTRLLNVTFAEKLCHHVPPRATIPLYQTPNDALAPQVLFDLASDPGETTDVSALHPAHATEMLAALHAWQITVKVSAPGFTPALLCCSIEQRLHGADQLFCSIFLLRSARIV
jgi:hypothetical protein